jgi:hypothetical protein
VGKLDDAAFWVGRLFIRTGRVAVGLLLGAASWGVGGEALEQLGKPFVSASVLSILWGLGLACATLALFGIAFTLAFGEAPREVHERASAIEKRRLEELEQRGRAEKEAAAALARASPWKRLLFDPSFAEEHRIPYILAVVATLTVAFALVAGLALLAHRF